MTDGTSGGRTGWHCEACPEQCYGSPAYNCRYGLGVAMATELIACREHDLQPVACRACLSDALARAERAEQERDLASAALLQSQAQLTAVTAERDHCLAQANAAYVHQRRLEAQDAELRAALEDLAFWHWGQSPPRTIERDLHRQVNSALTTPAGQVGAAAIRVADYLASDGWDWATLAGMVDAYRQAKGEQ